MTSPADGHGDPPDRPQSDHNVLREQINAQAAISDQHVRDLIAASREQTASNDRFAKAMVEYQERARLAKRRYRITIALLVAFFVALLIRQEIGNRAAQDARHTLLDCIVPTGHCYQHSQSQTAKVVGSLNKVATLAAACAPNYTALPLAHRIVAIERCIRHNLR